MQLLDILLLAIAAVVLRHWWSRITATGGGPDNLPPGPPGWPVVGNLFQVTLQRRPFMYVVRDLRKKYGPIFTLQMGQRTLIIVSGSDLIHEALVQKGPGFASRPPESPIRLIFSVGKCAINSAEYGPLWRALRRNFISEVVNPTRIRQYGWVRKWAFENHMTRVKNEAKKMGLVHVMDNCRLTICSVLICICFGAKISEDWIKRIESVLKDVMMMTTPKLVDFLPILTSIFGNQLKEAKKLREKQLDCLIPLVRNRKKFVENNGKREGCELEMASEIGAAYIDSLFNIELKEKGGRRLAEEELVTLCSEIINAGTDTSATAVEWALLHLTLNQEIQMKLYEEIIKVVGKQGVITEDHVEKMVYLQAIIKETFRRHPPSHFLLSHAAVTATELGGYGIPVGANVEFYTAWVVEDPNMWQDPEEFRPERFLEGGEGVHVDWTGRNGVKMLPFGAGRRICPAWTLGVLHISMLLAQMVHKYKWVPIPGCPPDPTETFAFTVVMKNPLKAVILPRSIKFT